MRALAVVLVAAFVFALSGAGSAPAQENTTPGIWINPELGLATPADAARRYEGPFHAWWIDEDDPIRQEPDWRERAFLLFGEGWSVKLRIWSQVAARDISLAKLGGYAPKTGEWHDKEWPVEIPPPPPGPAPLRVESCADLLAAYREGLRLRPVLELAWHGSRLSHFRLRVHRFFECLALEHLTRLQPLALQAAQRAQTRALSVAQGRQALAAGLQLGRLALTLMDLEGGDGAFQVARAAPVDGLAPEDQPAAALAQVEVKQGGLDDGDVVGTVRSAAADGRSEISHSKILHKLEG
jgi:hypothetical protein